MSKLSIWSYYYYELTIEEAITRFIQNGIHCCELADEHGFELLQRSEDVVATGKELAKFIKEHDFEISQGHLWLKARICSDAGAIEKLYQWIDLYEAIGIKNMVLHCDQLVESGLSKEERVQKNIEQLKKLSEYIRGRNITICLENLRPHMENQPELVDRNADDLLHIIAGIGSDQFGICLDTGHLNLTDKNHGEFIKKAGTHLKALHIADNEGTTDQHMMPFTRGTVDFVEVVRALRSVDYRGVFNLEIPGEFCIPIELRDEKIKYIRACYDYLMQVALS
ncbi:MAG: sugar phosphate isomerase/epimerase [Ruminococcaceae bacterium]|nr:sugar phosphate isomerase/epimerase [Oscillospiraceae bacterium]